MNDEAPDPLRARNRTPLAPTIRPSFGFGTSKISVFLYAIVAVAMAGYGIYQIKVQHLDIGNWRVLVSFGGALYFAVRVGFMFVSQWIDRDDDDDDTKKDGA